MRPPLGHTSSKRELNQFSKYSSLVPEDSKKAPSLGVLGGALFGFAGISLVYSFSLLGILSVLRDAGAISWSLSFLESLAVSALVTLIRTMERALNAISLKDNENKNINLSSRNLGGRK